MKEDTENGKQAMPRENSLPKEHYLDLSTVLQAVANEWDVCVEDIKSKSRLGNVARARQMAMIISRKYIFTSNKETAKSFERDRSTVTHALKAFSSDMSTSEPYAARYNRIIESLKNE